MENLELREIDIPSPVKGLNIGEDFSYKGNYKGNYEEGISKIKRFYKDVPFWDGKEQKLDKDDNYGVWMQLENDKLILLGFIGYKNKFYKSKNFDKQMDMNLPAIDTEIGLVKVRTFTNVDPDETGVEVYDQADNLLLTLVDVTYDEHDEESVKNLQDIINQNL